MDQNENEHLDLNNKGIQMHGNINSMPNMGGMSGDLIAQNLQAFFAANGHYNFNNHHEEIIGLGQNYQHNQANHNGLSSNFLNGS